MSSFQYLGDLQLQRHIPGIVAGQFLESGQSFIEAARLEQIDRQRAAQPGIVIGPSACTCFSVSAALE